MNSVDFCFWLQGFFEISSLDSLTDKQVEVIKSHLHLVFKHEIDPLRESQTETPTSVLNSVHQVPGINDPLIRC